MTARGLFSAVLWLGCATSVAGQQPVVPVTLTRLELAMRLDYAEGTLSGVARLRVRNRLETTIDRVPLQVGRLMEVSAATDGGGAPLRFSQDVVRYTDWPARQMNQVWVDLAAPLGPGDSTDLVVTWDGYVTPYTETGMSYVRERIDSAFTILRTETGAFPFLGVPSFRGNRAVPLTEAELAVRVTVPAYEVVATGGRFVGRTVSHDTATYEYRLTLPALLLNVAIAPYRTIEGEARVSYFPADSVGAVALAGGVQRALAALTTWFGPVAGSARPYIIEIPDGYGSQASLSGGIIQTAAAFRAVERRGEAYHELSHLWNVPATQGQPSRWEEGLAQFLQVLLAYQLDGGPAPDAFMDADAATFVKRHAADSLVTRVPLIEYGRRGSTDLSYSVGKYMCYVLYATLGPAGFNRVLGGFYQEHHATGATDLQFVEFAKRQSPYDLGGFFSDWFLTTRWSERLRRGETLHSMAEGYRSRRTGR